MQYIKADSIDEYIAAFPAEVQKVLHELRAVIQKEAPKAKEAIKYGIPTFIQDGNLVHFAAFNNHIGFYPAPSGIAAFGEEFAPYHTGKGTLQFPLGEKIPYPLIRKVVKFRIKENHEKSKGKTKKKSAVK